MPIFGHSVEMGAMQINGKNFSGTKWQMTWLCVCRIRDMSPSIQSWPSPTLWQLKFDS